MDSRDRAQRTLLEPQQAVYHAAHDYPGGIKAIAAIYGVSPTILANKVNPNYAGNTLDLRTALMVWDATRDERVPEAFAAYFGGTFVPDSEESAGELGVLLGISSLNRAMSSMVDDVASAMSDGRITQAEEAVIAADAKRLSATARSLMNTVHKARSRS